MHSFRVTSEVPLSAKQYPARSEGERRVVAEEELRGIGWHGHAVPLHTRQAWVKTTPQDKLLRPMRWLLILHSLKSRSTFLGLLICLHGTAQTLTAGHLRLLPLPLSLLMALVAFPCPRLRTGVRRTQAGRELEDGLCQLLAVTSGKCRMEREHNPCGCDACTYTYVLTVSEEVWGSGQTAGG